MSPSSPSAEVAAGAGAITDDAVAALRRRIGVAVPHPVPPHYRRPGTDAFRHVAEAYGDDNPLWHDDEHAATTRWGGPIAPPALVGGDTLVGENEVTAVDEETRALMKGDPLRGVHAFYASSEREWWAPLRPDRRVFRRNALVAALDKESEFAGRAVHEWTADVFRDEDGVVLAGQYRNMIRTERERASEKRKYLDIAIDPYDPADLEAIDRQYAAETLRGAEPRCWEDVEVGDRLPTMVKGPLTVTDIVCWHVGMGMGLYGVRPLRLAWANRQRIPRFYTPNELGVPDVRQRVHWDPAHAREVGNPTTFDYGRMRETWLIHLCTDWMGDDAWLWKLGCEFRRFNYVGDTTWLSGVVTSKHETADGSAVVELELEGRNQRDEVTTVGAASVVLPRRSGAPAVLPIPPAGPRASLHDTLGAIAEAFLAR